MLRNRGVPGNDSLVLAPGWPRAPASQGAAGVEQDLFTALSGVAGDYQRTWDTHSYLAFRNCLYTKTHWISEKFQIQLISFWLNAATKRIIDIFT